MNNGYLKPPRPRRPVRERVSATRLAFWAGFRRVASPVDSHTRYGSNGSRRTRRRSFARSHDLRRHHRAAHSSTPCRRVLSRAVARRLLPYLSMHRLRLFAQQDSSMRHAGHMSTVCVAGVRSCVTSRGLRVIESYKCECESAARDRNLYTLARIPQPDAKKPRGGRAADAARRSI